jgi:hypothetical protein
MISNDQRSPSRSSETLTGQPERRFDFRFRGIARHINKCNLQNASDMKLSAGIPRRRGVANEAFFVANEQWVLSQLWHIDLNGELISPGGNEPCD